MSMTSPTRRMLAQRVPRAFRKNRVALKLALSVQLGSGRSDARRSSPTKKKTKRWDQRGDENIEKRDQKDAEDQG